MKKVFLVIMFSLFAHMNNYSSAIKEKIQSMTLKQKIGQFFMPGAFALPDEPDVKMIEALIRDYHIGGLIFMSGDAEKQRELVDRYQKTSKDIPLFIAQDAEWGVSMRLPGATQFPRNMTLGAIQDNDLLYEFGREVGRQCKAVGVNINFAPVVDVNNNPKNPVINDRSLGDDPKKVAEKGIAIMKGIQSQGVLACAKHFCGHGNTETDSHHGLPVQNQTYEELEKVELVPFRALIDAGVAALMTAHIHFSALDSTPGLPLTLSPSLEKLAREKLGFKGLIFTDSLKMQAIADQYSMAEAALKAFLAGSDVIIFCKALPDPDGMKKDIESSIEALEKAVKDGVIKEAEIDKRVERILCAKKVIIGSKTKSPGKRSLGDLTSKSGKKLKRDLYGSAVTLVSNKNNILNGLRGFDRPLTSFVQVGGSLENVLRYKLSSFYNQLFHIGSFLVSDEEVEAIVKEMQIYEVVIVALYDMNKFADKNWGVSSSTEFLLQRLKDNGKIVVLCVFGNPYSLQLFSNEDVVIVGYENCSEAESAVSDVILGKTIPQGKLPVVQSEPAAYSFA
jgi:beta-glucosidase-like glycosyl hydrolase